MKRILYYFIGLFLISNLYGKTIGVKVYDDSRISFDLLSPNPNQINLGWVRINNTYLSSTADNRVILKNHSDVPISFSLCLKIDDDQNLKPVTSTPGENEFRIFGLFHQWDASPTKDMYQEDDILATELKDASTNVFAILNHKDENKAFNVLKERELSFFIRFDSPTFVSPDPSDLDFQILIKAYILYEEEEPHKKPDEKIFTPNNDGINDKVVFHGLSRKLLAGDFAINIFDVRGRLIRSIKDVEYWDGKDSQGKIVRTGVYLYQYPYDNKVITGIIIVAR